ncbi:hypothetical protein [Streptomyces sp. cmx-18-6]|uniref:hypothetical protein n=1 Tax=Streptomyces sp. cmx-18-6 TaxID=2790930 RepID=UPI0039811D35
MTSSYLGSVCRHWIGAELRRCGATSGVRPFLVGPCCPLHTPAALAGRPEAPETTSLPATALPASPISGSRVADARAIASGKRRSNPQAYRAAQAEVRHTTT